MIASHITSLNLSEIVINLCYESLVWNEMPYLTLFSSPKRPIFSQIREGTR